jgi:hypothetical protein
MREPNRYEALIERVFTAKYDRQSSEVVFERDDIIEAAAALSIPVPRNLGDVVYSFRYRTSLPPAISGTAQPNKVWIIRPAGRGRYRFVQVEDRPLVPREMLAETKIPNATPGIVAMYAMSDEQALLAKVRYNRLIDVFTGTTCFSLQNHLRTTVPRMGQVETDEIYVGLDRRGAHYVFPVQAKGGRDRLSIVQIEQDIALCQAKFPLLICRPVAAQFIESDLIALFEFESGDDGVLVSGERHYRLVAPEEMSADDLAVYRIRPNTE